MLTAGVVGLGYWGPNLARNLAAHPEFTLAALCDTDPARLERHGALYPAARRVTRIDDLLSREPPDLVAIATPVGTHHALARRALEAQGRPRGAKAWRLLASRGFPEDVVRDVVGEPSEE